MAGRGQGRVYPHDLLNGGVRGAQGTAPQPLQSCPAPQDFLAKHANRKGTWIGLRDLDIEGEFIWMDENPLNYR